MYRIANPGNPGRIRDEDLKDIKFEDLIKALSFNPRSRDIWLLLLKKRHKNIGNYTNNDLQYGEKYVFDKHIKNNIANFDKNIYLMNKYSYTKKLTKYTINDWRTSDTNEFNIRLINGGGSINIKKWSIITSFYIPSGIRRISSSCFGYFNISNHKKTIVGKYSSLNPLSPLSPLNPHNEQDLQIYWSKSLNDILYESNNYYSESLSSYMDHNCIMKSTEYKTINGIKYYKYVIVFPFIIICNKLIYIHSCTYYNKELYDKTFPHVPSIYVETIDIPSEKLYGKNIELSKTGYLKIREFDYDCKNRNHINKCDIVI